MLEQKSTGLASIGRYVLGERQTSGSETYKRRPVDWRNVNEEEVSSSSVIHLLDESEIGVDLLSRRGVRRPEDGIHGAPAGRRTRVPSKLVRGVNISLSLSLAQIWTSRTLCNSLCNSYSLSFRRMSVIGPGCAVWPYRYR